MSPFFVENTEVLIQKVVEISYDINHSDFQQVSPEAKDFVAMLLKRNPTLVVVNTYTCRHTVYVMHNCT